MRVRGVYHDTGEPSPTDPCFDYAWGETEDYSVVINQAGAAPVADFIANSTSVLVGQPVSFTDLSTNAPYQWAWTFTGGSPGSSMFPNPTNIIYSLPGCYEVSLVATNGFGSDSEVRSCYIDVTLSTGVPENSTAALTVRRTTDGVEVQWPWSTGSTDVELLDAAGKRIALKRSSGSSEQLSLSGLQAGLYVLVVRQGDAVLHQRLVHPAQ